MDKGGCFELDFSSRFANSFFFFPSYGQRLGYGEYSAKFLKNEVSGQYLVTMTNSDLKAIGVAALGTQKALLAKIGALGSAKTEDPNLPSRPKDSSNKSSRAKTETSEGDLSSAEDRSDVDSSSVGSPANRLELVVIYGESKRSARAKRTYSLERVLALLEEMFSFPVEITVKGQKILEQDQWLDVVNRHGSADAFEIEVEREDPNKIHKAEKSMLQGLTDACFVLDTKGTILFLNFAAEETFGYESPELIGQNIKMLTPPEIKAKHDGYLRRYLETGNAKVIGTGRQVQVIHKDGHEVSCWLSVNEQKKVTGRHTFMGTLHEIKSRETSSQTAKFAVLDGVQEAVLVINSQGIMQFMNGRMEKLLGYNKEILGRNINNIMPEPYSSAHDGYLRSYLKSGVPKIIGKGGRIVVAKHLNGSVTPVHLEVDECILEGQRYFVGVMVAKDSTRRKKVSLLEKQRAVVDQLAVATIMINPRGIVQAYNTAAAHLLGYEAHEVISKNVSMLMNDVDAKAHDGYLENHMRTGEHKIIGKFRNVVAKHKTGKAIDVTLSISKAVDPDDANNILFTGTIVASGKK